MSQFIYIMASESWGANVYKVGLSSAPERRAKQLYSAGLPYPVQLVKTAKVADMRRAEVEVHLALECFHVSKEFFRADLARITAAFDRVATEFDRASETPALPCRVCGHPAIKSRLGYQPVCSDECRWRYYNRKRPKVQHDPKPCAHCGEEFTPRRSDARFCSTKCRVYAGRES